MGSTTLDIPAMALGIMRMDQKSIPEAQVAIQAAYDSGINFIDSADIYGGGKSEEVFGQALKQMNLKRDDLFIQSKTGIVPGKRYDFSKDYILKGVDGILDRMGLDYLDALVLHRPDALFDPEEVAVKPLINCKLAVKYVSLVFLTLMQPNLNYCKVHWASVWCSTNCNLV